MHPSHPLLLLLASATLGAADIHAEPRLSLGGCTGLGQDSLSDDSSDAGSGPAAATNLTIKSIDGNYNTRFATNLEIPLLFSFHTHYKPRIIPIAGPAIVYSRNTNDGEVTVLGTTRGVSFRDDVTLKDTFTSYGIKCYAGVALAPTDHFRCELLPYIGVAHLRRHMEESYSLTTSIGINRNEGRTADFSGNMLLYGSTLGGYYTFESLSGAMIGGRMGYCGGRGRLDGATIRYDGTLIAMEIGWIF